MKVYLVVGGFAYEGEFVESDDCKVFASEDKANEWHDKLMAEKNGYDYVTILEREVL